MSSADDWSKIFNFFNIFQNSNFHCHIWIWHEKCIKMSINKTSIGAAVPEF